MKRTKILVVLLLLLTTTALSAKGNDVVKATAVSPLAMAGYEKAIYKGGDRQYILSLLPVDWDGSIHIDAVEHEGKQNSDDDSTIIRVNAGLTWDDLRRTWWLDCLGRSDEIPERTGNLSLLFTWEKEQNSLLRTGFEAGTVLMLKEAMEKGTEIAFPLSITMALTPSAGAVSFPLTFGVGFLAGFDAYERQAFFGPAVHASFGLEARAGQFVIALTTRMDLSMRLLAEQTHDSVIELSWTPVTFSLGAAF